ncbi:MAG TPA: STAS domain-containing protein, partial [Opitutales bacterium]|nr:STAS domain-containing protein [Opitutales bacterium]
AITLLIIVLVAAPLVKYVPLASLSAVLMVVAFNMGEWHHFRRLATWPRGDAIVFLLVFSLTVLFDIVFAIEAGMILAAILFIKRITESSEVTAVDQETETEGQQHSIIGREIPKEVLIFRVFGPMFFGTIDTLETALKGTRQHPKIYILRMRKVPALDASGITMLEGLHKNILSRGEHLILSGLPKKPLETLRISGVADRIGEENICPNIDLALSRANEILAKE